MSLLNQVLKDLEKRKAENTAEHTHLRNVKAVPFTQKKSYYLPLFLICLTSIIAFFTYYNQKNHATELNSETPVASQKQILAIKTTNDTEKKTPAKKQLAEIVPSDHKGQVTKTAEDKIKHSLKKKLAIKSTRTSKQKDSATKLKKTFRPITKKPKVQIITKLSNKQKAEQLFEISKKPIDNLDRQKNLELVLLLDPKHIKARLLLSSTLLTQGLVDKTTELLDQGLKILPQNLHFINLRSQLYLQNKQSQTALTLLQQLDTLYVQDETYLNLLAAAYQQNNDDFKSLQTYQRLLKINSQKAEYWLGLALASEKQGDAKQALTAYQQALNKKTLKNDIVSYIKQRLSLLK